jgi:hypothetical protein
VTQIEALAEKPASANKPLRVKRMGLLDRPFYFCMSMLIGVVVIYGFSRTVGPKLIHSPSPPPLVLYLFPRGRIHRVAGVLHCANRAH